MCQVVFTECELPNRNYFRGKGKQIAGSCILAAWINKETWTAHLLKWLFREHRVLIDDDDNQTQHSIGVDQAVLVKAECEVDAKNQDIRRNVALSGIE